MKRYNFSFRDNKFYSTAISYPLAKSVTSCQYLKACVCPKHTSYQTLDMPSYKSRKSIDPVAQAVAKWLKKEENREYREREHLSSIEKRMEENREESKLFAKFVKAAMADGKTMRQAMDEWNARQNEAKAEKEAKRQAEAAIFEAEYRVRLAASYVDWEAFDRAERAVAHARWEAKRV